ncbi:hypothetical protein SAMN04489835_3534 [Mycolicibacterium rutilum]|uniref:Uncharacterized protein n=1 Tax=Mycolicibacterium rutilum TaxID=370526 RepID=A0A1H6KRH4_MYCRU|nr:hypothetical protein [Mycolicibacterium rutilum]SEH74222.1 hypothetical protein SAMN04489835_3534 [Mycolicibacterium rutilum]
MTSTNNQARRIIAAGAFAVAAVAAPFAASVLSDASDVQAGPACLAWFGNKEDGKCLSYSNGNGVNVGTPDLGVYGPNSSNVPGGGVGVSTGPLFPGQTWSNGIN